jgi:hypothetical protein
MKTQSTEDTLHRRRTRQPRRTTVPSTTGPSRSKTQRPRSEWVLRVLIGATALFGVLNSAFLGFCLGVFVESTRRDASENEATVEEAVYQTAFLQASSAN